MCPTTRDLSTVATTAAHSFTSIIVVRHLDCLLTKKSLFFNMWLSLDDHGSCSWLRKRARKEQRSAMIDV